MQIKIIQSFAHVNSAVPLRIGETVTVPDAIGQQWIALGRARAIAQPESATKAARETATKPRPRSR